MLGILITMFAGVFWFLRVIITLMCSMEIDFPVVPINMNVEIVLLFVTFICVILVAKRKMFGAVVYLIVHCAYFGVDAYKAIQSIIEEQADLSNCLTLFFSIIAVMIPVMAIFNIGLDTGKKGSMLRDKKTDWFYGTTDYERQKDDRVDQNQYKF